MESSPLKPNLYIETSVISYFTARPSRDLIVVARQRITYEWWEVALPFFEAHISPVVLEEISRGNLEAASKRRKAVASFPLLEVIPEVRDLAEVYFTKISIPEKSRADTYHLALATWHGMDYLVSWNCRHIAGAGVRRRVEEINAVEGIRTPTICTPEELMEVGNVCG